MLLKLFSMFWAVVLRRSVSLHALDPSMLHTVDRLGNCLFKYKVFFRQKDKFNLDPHSLGGKEHY